MEQIRWSERFSVGVPEMDVQHMRIIELINALRSASDSEATTHAIAGMFEYAATHFRAEEHLLGLVGYSELPQQRREHRAFLDKAGAFATQALSSNESKEEVVGYLRMWMTNHILQADMKYALCIPDHLKRPVPLPGPTSSPGASA